MTAWYVSSTAYAAIAQWSGNHTFSSGAIVRPLTTPAFGRERVFRAETVTGATGATEPDWDSNSFNGSTVTDGGVIWRNITGQAAYGWSAAAANHTAARDRYGSDDNDIYYVSSDHHEIRNDGSDLDMQVPGKWEMPCRVVSVNRAGSVPPGPGDYQPGAIVEVTGASAKLLLSSWQSPAMTTFHGVTFRYEYRVEIASYITHQTFTDCRFEDTSAVDAPTPDRDVYSGGLDCGVVFVNCVFKCAGATAQFFFNKGKVHFRGGSIDPTGTIPNYFLHVDDGGLVEFDGFDWSAMTAGTACVEIGSQGLCVIRLDKNLPAGVKTHIFGNDENAIQAGPDGWLFVTYPDGSAEKITNFGIEYTDTAISRSGGANASRRIEMLSGMYMGQLAWAAVIDAPFETIPIDFLNSGANQTVTVHYITDAATLPDNSAIYMDARYNGGYKTTGRANILATPTSVTADTATSWGGPARTNSHAYSVGDVFANPSAGGQLCVVTAATGSSAASVPGGYASLADGGTLTDGGVSVRAMIRFKLSLTLSSPTPGAGPVRVQSYLDQNNGWRVWYDSKADLT